MSPVSLIELSYDLLLQIFALLDPMDLISIRNTCRIFLKLSYEKILWIYIADKVCERNSLFPPASMEQLDCLRLDAIATGPNRWEELLKSKQDFTPVHIRAIHVPDVHIFGQMLGFFLVPGGRFLLVAVDIPPQLVILDLDGTTPQVPLATMATTSEKLCFCFPSVEKEKLCIITRSSSASSLIDIYEISPYESNCAFVRIASFDPLLDSFGMESDRVAESYDTIAFKDRSQPILRLWNFRTDTWTASYLDCPPFYRVILVAAGDHIIFLHKDSFSICDIPGSNFKVSRFEAFQSQPNSRITPKYRRLFQASKPQDYRPDPDEWYSGSGYHPHPVFIKSFIRSANDTLLAALYRIDCDECLNDTPTALEPPLSVWGTMALPAGALVYRWSRLCNNGLYRTSFSSPGYIHCQGVIEGDGSPPQAVEQVLDLQRLLPDHDDGDSYANTSFCPAAGRMCFTYYCYEDSTSDTHTIYILDFLNPTTSGAPMSVQSPS